MGTQAKTQSRSYKYGIAFAVLVGLMAGLAVWWMRHDGGLPEGIAVGNGRLEAIQVDVAPKRPGRIAEVLAHEGDWVERGQTVVRMDTAELEARLRQAKAEVRRCKEGVRYAAAIIAQRESELKLARSNLHRTYQLYENDNISRKNLDYDQTAVQTAKATLAAAKTKFADAEVQVEAMTATMERIKIEINDGTLAASVSGRVLYRLAEPGEVIAAGGKILTLIDLNDVYMTLFLPARFAGRVAIGAEARIVLDTAPNVAIPAKVSFVSPKAQFTPKEVETQTEREKLEFRIKVQIDPQLLKTYRDRAKTGLPGVAYVRVDTAADWPEKLARKRSL